MVEPHRHEGIFIARGKEDVLVTKNMVVGESVYGEKRVSVEVSEQTVKSVVTDNKNCSQQWNFH